MIVNRFEEQVRRYPEQIAIKTVDRELSYQLLNSYANDIGNDIKNEYVDLRKNNSAVALLFEHGADMIIGTVGALKANRVYVPFDPSYPKKRLGYMLENSEATLIVTNNKNIELALDLVEESKSEVRIFNIDDKKLSDSIENISIESSDNDIAYILYTSGSTGKPKGVIQSNKNVIHFIESYSSTLNINHEDRITLFSAFSHDAAVMDIFGALLNGATLFPLDIKDKVSIDEIPSWIQNEGITIYHSVPTVFRYFVKTFNEKCKLDRLRFIVLGGESVIEHDVDVFQRLFNNTSTRMLNLYGQTESSYNSSQIISPDKRVENIVLGDAVKDTELLVIDENREEVSVLRVGEIVVLSEHIALGYWKDEEKTKEVFQHSEEAGKLYWTGDLGRLLEDGSIKFEGRKGSQVKIRGYRIELGEIETELLTHDEVKEAVVLGRKTESGDDYLSAYIVADKPLITEELRRHLSKQLPSYMIPSNFSQLEKIPLTPNNKVDRNALITAEKLLISEIEYEAPKNDIEKKLVKIWAEILGKDKIGINDNFFGLGGHSLKATILVAKIHKAFDVQISLAKVFESPTINEMAAYVKAADINKYIAIDRIEKEEYYPVSAAQKRMYFLSELEGNGINYNLPSILEIKGEIDKERLEKAFKELINRQESFRTFFEVIDGEIVQKVREDACFNIEYLDCTDSLESKIKDKVKNFTRPFDLSKAPLLRATVLKLESDRHILMYDMHHIISDGRSGKIFINELIRLYDGEKLTDIKIQYKDYAVWQSKFLKDNVNKKDEEYLLEEFKGELPVLNLPTDYSRPAIKQYDGDVCSICLEENLSKRLKSFALKNNATFFMVILEAISVVLSKYSDQEEIVIGTVTAGRTHADIENTIGLFLNNIAFRCNPKKELDVIEYLNSLREKVLKGYETQNYPIDELISKLDIENDMSRGRLFDVMVILQNYDNEIKEIETSKLNIKPYASGDRKSEYDMTFFVYDQNDKISISLEYCTKLFKRETVEGLLNNLVSLANDMIDNSDKMLSELSLMSDDEKKKIIDDFNSNSIKYPKKIMLHELFEKQAEETPDKIVVVHEDRKLTYKELNEKANQIARLLRNEGLGKDEIIGILADRSLEMFIGILGVLKAGAAYLPIDPIYPSSRIDYMIKDSGTKAILLNGKLKDRVNYDGLIINLDDEKNYIGSKGNIEACSTYEDLAYIIYTSGTTGKPKAIMTKHNNVVPYVFAFNEVFDIDSNTVTLQQASFTFDGLIEEVYTVIFKGGKIVVPSRNDIKDASALAKIINENKVTILSCSPLILNEFNKLPKMESVNTFLSSSDILRREYYSEIIQYANVYNMYGPSEATVCTTYYKCGVDDSENVPIGRPFGNNKIYILDSQLKVLPAGIMGEIYIGGDGIAKGYLNNKELTKSKFIPNPINSDEMLYKTGDVARWLPNGDIEFSGRSDFQVKVRGYRIELGEIESQLLKHDKVSEVAVVVKEDTEENKFVCVYYVADTKLSSLQLKEYLSEYLPEYMVPSFLIQIEKIPLNPNGKVDRTLLPEPSRDVLLETAYIKPQNEIEESVVEIWHEVLEIDKDKIGVKHNFFDLGGNSINILKVANKINEKLNVNISIGEVLMHQTIRELAESIHKDSIIDDLECVVKLNKSKSKKNIFIIHGEDGDVYYYKDLAKLLEGEYNVYGIQSRGIRKECDLTVSTEDMIKHYIKEIKVVQKEGPYIIGAYCIGCMIAYDLITMLEGNNEVVEKCIMFDEHAFLNSKIASAIKIKEHIKKPFKSASKYFIENAKSKLVDKGNNSDDKKDFIQGESKEYVPDLKAIKKINTEIGSKIFVPKRLINTPTYIIKAEQSNRTFFTLSDWGKMVNAKVEIIEIPGDHESIWQYPHVLELREAFINVMNK